MRDRAGAADLAEVEAALAGGFRWQRFPPSVEARFEADTGWQRCRFLIACGLVALLLFNLFLIRDHSLMRDVFPQALIVRLGLITPLALVMLAALSRNPAAWLRESMEAAMTMLVVAGVLYLDVITRSPLAGHAPYSLLLVVIFSNIVQRVRFWYACAASAVSLALCIVLVPHIAGITTLGVAGVLITMLSTVILTLLGNYNLELEQRGAYLAGLRQKLRSAEPAAP